MLETGAAPSTSAPWTLPDSGRLVHIGPPKTGSTAIQGAMFAARDALHNQGVHYVGNQPHSDDAIRAVMGRPSFRYRGQVPPARLWADILDEVRTAREPRVVLSSEFLAGADASTARRISTEFDARRTYALAMLRPLATLLPSQWQQNVRRGSREALEPWLRRVLGIEGTPEALFWRDHRTDRTLSHWVEAVGADHVVAVVLDDEDRLGLFRWFEHGLRLRDGTLQPQDDVANRSLTLTEAEAVRALNGAFEDAGIDWTTHARLVHMGAAVQLWRRPTDPADPRIELPQWALDRALELDAEMLAAIRGSGVHLDGDPGTLLRPRESRLPGDRQPQVAIPPDMAAAMAIGLLYGTGLVRDPDVPVKPRAWLNPPALVPFSARQLAVAILGRAVHPLAVHGRRLSSRVRARLPARG
jgi:hypothetical protein